MLKKLLIVLLVASSFSCHKNQQSACGTGKVCTAIFATINIKYTDKDGKVISVDNYSAINQRTKRQLEFKSSDVAIAPAPGTGIPDIYYLMSVANDNMRDQFSTEGDNILITATNPTTHQTKSVTLKISGGCNCHVAKLSGPDVVAFD